jgi:LysM repeat protein
MLASSSYALTKASAKTKKVAAKRYTVKKEGEALSTIARRSGVSVEQLAAANGISSSHRVHTGERLKIPD